MPGDGREVLAGGRGKAHRVVTHSVEEIAKHIGADSLGYLSHEGLMGSVGEDEGAYCSACFSGNYPIPLPEEGKDQLRLFEKVRE